MEIFAQWLDNVDDLVFALALIWEEVRLRCLECGLVAALLLVNVVLTQLPIPLAMTLSGVCAASVMVWLLGAGIYYSRRPEPRRA
jgi:hypothetical protein